MSLTPADIPVIRQALLTQVPVPLLAYLAAQGLPAPLAYWRMDAYTGVTEADVSGNGNTLTYANSGGTLTGVTLAQPGITQDGDTAALFASSGYAAGTNTLPPTTAGQALTLITYLYLTGYQAGVIYPILAGVSGGPPWSYGIAIWPSGEIGIMGGTDFGDSSALPLNQWVQVALAYTSAGCLIYFNGTLAGGGETDSRLLVAAQASAQAPLLAIGYPFAGAMDETFIIPATLTAGQLTAIDAIVRGSPLLANAVNVGKWAGLTVPATLPNSGPVALTAAAYDAVARAILGQGQSDNPGASCVVNRVKTLSYWCSSRYERVVFVGIGDSNQIKDAYGWQGGFGYALSNSGGLWSSGLICAGYGTSGGVNLGYLCNAGSSGADASSGAPLALNSLMPAVAGLPWYSYTASGSISSFFTIDANCPVFAGNTADLSIHLGYGVNPGWSGTFTMGGRYDAGTPIYFAGLPAFLPPAVSASTGTSGAAAIADGTWEWATGMFAGDEPLRFDFGTTINSNGAGSGPMFLSYWQAENRSMHSGFSVNTLGFYGGESTRAMLVQLQAWGLTAIKENFRQAMLYAGPTRLCCVRINEGLNDRGDTAASWDKSNSTYDGPASNTQQGFYNNTEGIMLLLQQAWAGLGYPASSLYFQLTVSHPQSLPDDANLTLFRAATDALGSAYANTCSVHLDEVTSFADLSYNQYYEGSGTSPSSTASAHLVSPGYNYLATLEVAGLQPTGIEVVLDAVQRATASAQATIAANLNATVSSRSTYAGGTADADAAAIKAKTDLINTNAADSPNAAAAQATIAAIASGSTKVTTANPVVTPSVIARTENVVVSP